MKVCQLCFKSFPSSKRINGKLRVYSSRKYCLDCSPAGKHNTRKLELHTPHVRQLLKKSKRICVKHPNTEMCVSEKGRYRCRPCTVDAVRKHRKRLKVKAIEYKGGRCFECGYNTCPEALHFHHRDPSKKDFSLAAAGTTRSWAKIKAEIDKCDLLCANCHAETHAGF